MNGEVFRMFGDMKYLICCNFFPLNFTRLADFDYLVPNHNLGK